MAEENSVIQNGSIGERMEIDEKISVRLGRNELLNLDKIIKDAGYASRSEFIRSAVKTQITVEARKNLVSVEIPGLILGHIDSLVEREYYLTREDAIQKAICYYFTHEKNEYVIKTAKGMERTAGREFEIDVDGGERKVIKQ